MAEIEDLVRKLKKKVARFGMLRAVLSCDLPRDRANETAVTWIHDALEDISATALGIETASGKLFLRVASAEALEPKEMAETPNLKETTVGTAE
ncbi:hypothetical protein [Arthrobacter sp. MMS18-M83]|uniref:hypothetical protein n=1 Tax=Arthrobacter sp. MMS18-M83 TaxID=2996261 RepID=UPI00227BAC89|nr:hypothetical protein [Arthrobacter sp. MMS18-M83]WAH98227.1 hypothetical protein OW521_04950 [Arthrobacter sp. MMS18-M83]